MKGYEKLHACMKGYKKTYVTKEQAASILPDGETIHTFRNSIFSLVGADWSREDIMEKLDSSVLELSGPGARGMSHGLCAYKDKNAHFEDALFIETDEDRLVKLEKELEGHK